MSLLPQKAPLHPGPLPWDGVLPDEEPTPPGSPRVFLRASSSRRASPAPAKRTQPSVAVKQEPGSARKGPQMQEITNTVPRNPLGATFLDTLNQKLGQMHWYEPGSRERGKPGDCHKDISSPPPLLPRNSPFVFQARISRQLG